MERNLKARKLIISGCFFAGVSFSSKSLHIKTERSEEHTSELQSPDQLVCRLLLEKKIKELEWHAYGRAPMDIADVRYFLLQSRGLAEAVGEHEDALRRSRYLCAPALVPSDPFTSS